MAAYRLHSCWSRGSQVTTAKGTEATAGFSWSAFSLARISAPVQSGKLHLCDMVSQDTCFSCHPGLAGPMCYLCTLPAIPPRRTEKQQLPGQTPPRPLSSTEVKAALPDRLSLPRAVFLCSLTTLLPCRRWLPSLLPSVKWPSLRLALLGVFI